ncbi:FAD/NAD(P)-binding oxidoreductase [Olivibacter sp. XZL3]|uniref:NAD(P)/FAD-dependent oxidoreductase n=1 Tax=Olivibacter sp. XZL3 TaxID=1735116 RepID=UPI001065C635|nr:FAD/NAD(P)-binding oxidoreductase [Olivibacter sp. XZL3]
MKNPYQILIIGGGTAGIMVAAQLKKQQASLSIAIIEPSETHYYQAAFTLVGAGTYAMSKTKRSEASLIPSGVVWIKDRATVLFPDENKVVTEKSGSIGYDYLVVAPGLVYDLSLIDGLEDALNNGVACSNYINPEYTWKCLQNFKGGNAIFTQPATPIKCGGAPQKAMYLAADYFRRKGISDKTNVVFATPGTVIFGVKSVADTLMRVIDRYKVNLRLYHTPVKIDADKRLVYFKDATPDDKKAGLLTIPGATLTADNLLAVPFDFLHLAPPQTAPEFILKSDLCNETGWLDVDINSLQHKKYDNVFGLGDVAGLPTAKTGAAVRKQAPVVVDNILNLLSNKPANNKGYEGYSSCPLVTGYGKMVLAEFNYKNEFTPDPMLKYMLVNNSDKEHWRLWLLKKYGLPYLYWNKMMKGEM